MANFPLSVSRETQDRLEKYRDLLHKWQARINLVAPDTLADSRNRHFLDSLQILPHISGHTLLDMGTGAGFPGLVLAIARPDLSVHLLESDAKKCEFLKTVSRETGVLKFLPDPGLRRDDNIDINIHNMRIEKCPAFFVDMITARALSPLAELLEYAHPYSIINQHVKLIYLKGATWKNEIDRARESYDFNVEDHESLTSPQGRVLIITQVKKR